MAHQSNVQEGQKFYVKLTGNAARYDKDGGFDTVVSKVGRKYFTLSVEDKSWFERDIKFSVEDLCQVTNTCTDYVLYSSREEYDKRNLKPKRIQEISNFLSSLTYEQVLEIQVELDIKYKK